MHWDRFLRFNGIEPLVVVYEELAAAYVPTLERVLRAVAPGAERTAEPAAPAIRRLSDERSQAFLERFQSERRERGLPHPLALPADG